MKIAIVGSGFIGGQLGGLWAACGHEVVFATRDPESDKMRELLARVPQARASSATDAVRGAEVVLLALPGKAIETALVGLDLQGKVVIDAMNRPGGPSSATQAVLQQAPQSRVVKAFNTMGGENLAYPVRGGLKATIPLAGDDPEAKAVVAQLIEDIGFEALDVGPLAMAGTLEQMALVWMQLSRSLGRNFAWKILPAAEG